MSAPAITRYQSSQTPARDGFAQLLLAEWTKFRTVRGWVIALVAAGALVVLATVALAGTAKDNNSVPTLATGPGGQAVTDSFYFVSQPLGTHGSVTARVTSLTGKVLPRFPGAPLPPGHAEAQPWAKAGIVITASSRPGSAYAAMMVTPAHGVRLQYNFTGDIAGLPGGVSSSAPRWLRLTRSGDVITGYDSADGRHWISVGSVRLAGLPAQSSAGLFIASPPDDVTRQEFASNDGFAYDTQATAAVDQVAVGGGVPGATWHGAQVGASAGPDGQAPPVGRACGNPASSACSGKHGQTQPGAFRSAGASLTLTGSGDIAPYVPIVDPVGLSFKGSLAGLIVMIALGALFMTSEYRRGLIRTTFTASPRRGRVLLAKAIVLGSVTFLAGLIGAAIAFPIVEAKVRANGWLTSIYPIRALTSGIGLQLVVGTAALLAVSAVLALAAGALLRHSAGAIAASVAVMIFPLVLATLLPQTPAQWLLRLTPAAAFGLQQDSPQYSQVSHACLPYNGCYPLLPWAGFAVLCAWAAVALGVASYVVHRRDA